MRYAENTEVIAEKSRMEIERVLTKYGADQFMYSCKELGAVVGFRMKNRYIRFTLPVPDKNSKEFKFTKTRRQMSPKSQLKAWEQATRQRWRVLALTIKAKLEACDCGITEFEPEFMAYIVMPDGKTVADHILPKINEAYINGR